MAAGVLGATLAFGGPLLSGSRPASAGPCPVAPQDATACIQQLLLSPGAVFDGAGQTYEVDHGVTVPDPQNITVENASFRTSQGPMDANGIGSGVAVFTFGGAPVSATQNSGGVTFNDVNVFGTHDCNGLPPRYQRAPVGTGYCSTGILFGLYGQAGLRFNGTADVTLDNVSTSNMWGDGIDIEPFVPNPNTPAPVRGSWHCASDLHFTNVTAWHDGRDGISPTCEQGMWAVNTNLSRNDQLGLDFEADFVGPHADNVWFTGLTANGVEVAESGSVHFVNWTAPDAQHQVLHSTLPAGAATIEVDNSSLTGPIDDRSGHVTTMLSNVAFTVPPFECSTPGFPVDHGDGTYLAANVTCDGQQIVP
jgi:hypothetical protein